MGNGLAVRGEAKKCLTHHCLPFTTYPLPFTAHRLPFTHYSGLMPAALTTLAARATSSLIYFVNSSGVFVSGSVPCAISACLTSGVLTVFTTAALMRFTISRGVPAGTITPIHERDSK